MKVCVVGAGGREHALAHVLGRTAEVVVTPGNPAIPGSVATAPEDVDADLFVIGPEAPLVDGLADRLRAAGNLVFGPGADGARLEGSKAWMKEVLAGADVPTARHDSFTDADAAIAFLRTLPPPWVVKTDGLAAGKGVLVTEVLAEAEDDVRAKLSGSSFGTAGERIVIEEGLTGPELSLLVVCDGTRAVPLAPAQDFKRIGDGDVGPNTGGMGSYSPVPGAGDAHELSAIVHQPLVDELRRRGTPFHGVLYAGLMLTPDGPRVIEYNARFGDPETQAVLPRLRSDLLELLRLAASPGGLAGATLDFTDDAAVTVVLASGGYPASSSSGDVISGLDDVGDGVEVTHAGTARRDDGAIVTAGGRVLNVTALGPDIGAARDAAYAAADLITFEGRQLRRDIALRAVGRT